MADRPEYAHDAAKVQSEPSHVLVPVGILERAGEYADEAADSERNDPEYPNDENADKRAALARALYAAARGEAVQWEAV